jgi:hypothetical protein
MTEKEWLATIDPDPMLRLLFQHKASDRKLRLFAAACCRHVWSWLTDERSQKAVEVAERFADNRATKKERRGKTTRRELRAASEQAYVWRLYDALPRSSTFAAMAACNAVSILDRAAAGLASHDARAAANCNNRGHEERMWQAGEVRDIFGNPFRPVTFDPAWRTTTTMNLAAAVYEDRHMPSGLFDNHRLDILADALEDAGCDNADILGHLRNGGEHVRGCHVIDLIRGKQ